MLHLYKIPSVNPFIDIAVGAHDPINSLRTRTSYFVVYHLTSASGPKAYCDSPSRRMILSTLFVRF